MELVSNNKTITTPSKVFTKGKNVRKIADLMENEKFRSLYNEYSSNWQDILFMMRLYEYVEKQQPNMDKEQKIACVVYLLKNKDTRQQIIDNYVSEQLKIC